jgi:ribosomal protein L40E
MNKIPKKKLENLKTIEVYNCSKAICATCHALLA